MRNTRIMIILAIAILHLFSGCNKIKITLDTTPKYGYTGYVKNLYTREPIKDAIVIAKRCTETGYVLMPYPHDICKGEVVEYARVTTDENGYFHTPYDSKKWGMEYEKAGYKPVISDSSNWEKDVYWLAPL